MSANDKQVGGDHYKTNIEPWDAITDWGLGYLDGSAVKYLSRWHKKGGVQDIEKAIHFLQKLIEVEHDRLCRALNTDDQATKAVASEFARQSPINGGVALSDATDRKPPATSLRGRDEGRDGTPTSLKDII